MPFERPESDGTLTWDHTTVVIAEVRAGPVTGIGLTYGPAACAAVIRDVLAERVVGLDAFDIPAAWVSMVRAVRSAGRPGIASMAIAAVELGLWDLKAKLLEVPLFRLLGAAREEVPTYASGGFTSLDDRELSEHLRAWAAQGFARVKMKIGIDGGHDPARDLDRIALARKAVGPDVELLVDANGAYARKQAIRIGRALPSEGVTWFEEPVSSDDLDGLREVREATDAEVAAGEYGYDVFDFARLVTAVDVLQADVTRCGGIHGWLRAAAIAASRSMEVSGHTAPTMHLHVACAAPNLRHLEYFHDHAAVERLLLDGAVEPERGKLRPDPGRPGHGVDLRRADAERYRKG
ncbi:MAG TPA: enolase C-terminal domain-like protein [Actinomycetota bacterium]|nr:enolase C-terminal domain-like protein [Actinomycetota bacterium]